LPTGRGEPAEERGKEKVEKKKKKKKEEEEQEEENGKVV
jgi:hypothetical protein